MDTTFSPEMLDVIEARDLESWQGTIWRQVFAGTPSLRSNIRGGRWNPPGTEALYASLLPETSAAEIDFLMSLQPVPILRDRLTIELEATLSRVTDLSDHAQLARVGLSIEDLTAEDPSRCQHVGAAVAWLGCGGLLVPSARHEGINLVVFVNNLGPDDVVQESAEHAYPPGPPAAE